MRYMPHYPRRRQAGGRVFGGVCLSVFHQLYFYEIPIVLLIQTLHGPGTFYTKYFRCIGSFVRTDLVTTIYILIHSLNNLDKTYRDYSLTPTNDRRSHDDSIIPR